MKRSLLVFRLTRTAALGIAGQAHATSFSNTVAAMRNLGMLEEKLGLFSRRFAENIIAVLLDNGKMRVDVLEVSLVSTVALSEVIRSGRRRRLSS